ncbi:MAG: hypothetical protein A2156_02460 [Deltaproteobacteria bacterium RBG_16_48_10]|nr:MAG: hypothetical protein A2156_02460 [Deltaproteobacteria bacterium RBG_16_48_10]
MKVRQGYWKSFIAETSRRNLPGLKVLAPLFVEMATIAHEILTIRMIKLWKYSCRIDLFSPIRSEKL